MTTGNPHLGESKLDLVVLSRRDAAEGVVVLELGSKDGADLPTWEPGAHIDLELANGMIRQYSLCGSPSDRKRWKIGVLREPESRGGSAFIHNVLKEGMAVHVVGPRNHFKLEPSGRYIFIAGGIGITPIIPMIAAVDAAGADWTLAYGGRSRGSMAFMEELSSRGSAVSVQPFDEVGHIDLASLLDHPDSTALVYCCGPEPLLSAVEGKCESWPSGALHLERFSAKPLEQPSFDGPFEVELAGSGQVYTVTPGESIMEVLEDAGLDVLCSCREGVCGSCETALISGAADHRDSVLSDDEKAQNSRIMICVSRSRTGERLVLDL
ncbi:PDR/VanB family oxidoreductase [Sphingobium sp. Cam5-1]|uniref:PDR/VanB family oxidoreductase n=1 Tax=Sphingobium sp. Cam5-1 TaxID=2789327 RepID=UPI0018AD2912|nr:PDR/VanB family oxidoreductase [Sphingobium sp. Cam5-1]QPI75097.1 oxidoreductase [Sphingobium sp. Cam5-1]